MRKQQQRSTSLRLPSFDSMTAVDAISAETALDTADLKILARQMTLIDAPMLADVRAVEWLAYVNKQPWLAPALQRMEARNTRVMYWLETYCVAQQSNAKTRAAAITRLIDLAKVCVAVLCCVVRCFFDFFLFFYFFSFFLFFF